MGRSGKCPGKKLSFIVTFLIATASVAFDVTPEIREKVERSGGLGSICAKVPQAQLLKHEAVGYFLTHAGSNSVAEATLAVKPMVFWPLAVDQPIISNQLALTFKVGIELMEVKTNCINKPTGRGVTPSGTDQAILDEMKNTWSIIRGTEGEKMKERLGALREEVLKEVTQGGHGFEALMSFKQWF